MASSSEISSCTSVVQNLGSEEDKQQLMNLRKQKRRQSKLRKRQFDDMKAEVAHLRMENKHILSQIKVIFSTLMKVKTQSWELSG